MLGRFERILDDVDHLDDALLLPVSTLLRGSVPYVRDVSLSGDGGGRLSGFDFAVDEFLEGGAGSIGGGLDFFFGRSFHGGVFDVGAVSEGDEILELRLHCAAISMSLLRWCNA